MNVNRYLFKINRISAWMLLVFMIIFLASGYAWTERIIMPVQLARWMHTQLDIYLVVLLLIHVLINTKFALKRWRIRHETLVNSSLLLMGMIIFILVLSI